MDAFDGQCDSGDAWTEHLRALGGGDGCVGDGGGLFRLNFPLVSES